MVQLRRAAVVLAVLAAGRANAQQPAPVRRETIGGVVTTASGSPFPNVMVIATRGPDRAFLSTTTDSAGRFEIVWNEGTGDYLVNVTAPGMKTVRKRLTRVADESEFVFNTTLSPETVTRQLAASVTTAARPKPDRTPDFGPGVGSAEQLAQPVVGAVAPDVAGDLAAIVATLPGYLPMSGGGVSVLGLGAAQNSTTLNGMAFAGAEVPRDARLSVRSTTATYDPARGWFSGAQTNVELAPGGAFSTRRGRLTFDAPQLQYTDAISAASGQQFGNLRTSLGGDGAFRGDRLFYNYGLQAGVRSGPARSLLDASPLLLSRAGVAADSAERFLQAAAAQGIPLIGGNGSDADARRDVSFLARLDRTPYDMATLAPARRTLSLTGYARYLEADGVGIDLTSAAAHAGSRSQATGALVGDYTFYFGSSYLGSVRSALSIVDQRSSPYQYLPEVRVRVQSALPDGTDAVASLRAGGTGAVDGDVRQTTWETIGEWQLYPPGRSRHRVRLATDVRFDAYRGRPAGNDLGRFTFNSLADFTSGNAASFTRTLAVPAQQSAVWNGYFALSDQWRATQAVQVLYGVRAEANRFVDPPAFNDVVLASLGVRTDDVPNRMHLSPRLGLTWTRQGREVRRSRTSNFGRFSGIANGVLRGGVGEFRSMLSPLLLAPASAATGLAGAQLDIACVGSAVPAVDWRAFGTSASSIPRACAVSGNPALADEQPSVRLVDAAYDAARSWRGNLTWTAATRGWVYTIEGVVSYNVNQPSTTNLNFSNVARFTLQDDGRPVYVRESDIVAGSGVVSPVGSRTTDNFSRVWASRSDASSISKQLAVTISPSLPGFDHWILSAGYVVSSVRARQRGFDGTTAESPTSFTWARGDIDVRHQLLAQAGYTRSGFTFTAFGRLQSGLPFTPMVASDINGDGLANDQAFVVTGLVSNTALGSLPSTVRSCLSTQAGGIAERNSCEGPWTAALNARLAVSGTKVGFGKRVDIGLNLANPLGGLDQLVHGENGLRGWGTGAAPNPTLLFVDGFDAALKRYAYRANPRFGSTDSQRNTIRAPFRVTLDVSVDIGRSIPAQQIDKWLRPGRAGQPGTKFTVSDFKRRYERNVPDPYRSLLEQSDSLLLTKSQLAALQTAAESYHVRVDSLWLDLSMHLASLPDRYDSEAAVARAERTIDAAWELTRLDVQRALTAILDPVQRTLLPFPAKMFFEARERLSVRMFNAAGR